MAYPTISPRDLKAVLGTKQEYALIDVREEGEFSKCHQLLALSIPLSHLEVRMGTMVPRKATPIFLADAGPDDLEKLAERACARLTELGYSDVKILEGGVKGWKDEGYKVFSGVFVPSKAFGEFVEHAVNTPRLEPEKVKAMLDEGRDMVVLDTRPNNEYQRMNIPTGINVPGGELAYRIADIAPNPETFVVVNCAGRTRSIIGCQSLINAGIPNKVVALKGGTMGWELAGLKPERGTKDRYNTARPSAEAVAVAKKRASKVAEKYGVKFIDMDTFNAWKKDATRSLYVIDVRQPAEYAAGHMPGSVSVQGVTVIQSTDTVVGVRNGRVVLVDDTEVRAIMAVSWMAQMGYPEVYVLRGGIQGVLEKGPEPLVILGQLTGKPISPEELQQAMSSAESPVLLDLGNSREFRKKHIPGACWGVRSRLFDARKLYSDAKRIVLTCGGGNLGRVATSDAEKLWPGAEVRYLEGGNEGWFAKGLPEETDMPRSFCPEVDVYNRPYEGIRSKEEERAAMIAYLSWEEGLVDDVIADGDLHFFIS